MTMTLISTVTVGAGGASSIDFSSIPQTYTDLQLVVSARSTITGTTYEDVGIKFNSSSSGYTERQIYANGSSAGSNANFFTSYGYIGGVGSNSNTANTFGNCGVYIPNYTGSSNKSFSVDNVTENNATGAFMNLVANLWSNTAAITSISLFPVSANTFMQYSTASLYGILKGSGGASVS